MGDISENSLDQLAKLRARLAELKEDIRNREEEKSGWRENSLVRISEDSMSAFLLLAPPRDNEETVYTMDVVQYMASQGVAFGVDEQLIREMLETSDYNREVEVAKGLLPVEGTDGFYEYTFTPESHTSPKILPDGSVDYTAMNMLQNVRAGDTLAIYHHAVPGKDGKDVRGVVLKPPAARELKPLRGLNVSNEADPDIYISLIDGKVELKDDRIDIQSTHEISGDVDYLMGKIEFFGDIVIGGNVEGEVTLRAGRNIVVHGTVGSAHLFAGGDIIIERGVQGNMKAKLSARGNVFADFLEHCTVEAGGNVEAGSIVDSHVEANEYVKVNGKKGVIVGGYVHATKGIMANGVGNDIEIKTILHSGYELKTYEEVVRLTNEERKLAEELQAVVVEMATILKGRANKDWKAKAMESKLPELDATKNALFKKIDSIKSDIDFYNMILEKGRGSKIEIRGHVYPGVIINIESSRYPVNIPTRDMRYQRIGGVIESSVIPV